MIAQAALIVLPVVTLSALALYGLRQDRVAILTEAKAGASAAASDAGPRIGARAAQFLAAERRLEGIVIESPVPPEWPEGLPADDAARWRLAEAALFHKQDLAAAKTGLNHLRRFSASPDVRANAELALVQLEPAPGAGRFLDVARRFPDALTESGAPLADVALLAAIRASGRGPVPEGLGGELTKRVRERPSFLTAQLLESAGKLVDGVPPDELERLQQDFAKWRVVMSALREQRALPAGEYVAFLTKAPAGWMATLLPSETIHRAFLKAVPSLQAHGAVSVKFAGRRWPIGGVLPVHAEKPVLLGSFRGSISLGQARPFELTIETDEAALYAGYRRRLWLNAALIVCAAMAAMIGLASLWRGYRRQARMSELKSNFVSSVSHELRAPLGAVRLMAENLEHGKVADPAQQHEYFRLIGQECRRLASLVDNVLDFARMESGRKQYTFEPMDMTSLLRHAVAVMEPVAADRGIRLVFTPPADGAAALEPSWDGAAIEESLVNLVDNAIKHSPPGSAVSLEVERTGSGVRLWVKDSGAGIPKEEQDRIFDLFYRSGSELRRETKGAGIGLSLVKHVAEAHGGRVLVVSEVGKGSQFGLELPVEAPL